MNCKDCVNFFKEIFCAPFVESSLFLKNCLFFIENFYMMNFMKKILLFLFSFFNILHAYENKFPYVVHINTDLSYRHDQEQWGGSFSYNNYTHSITEKLKGFHGMQFNMGVDCTWYENIYIASDMGFGGVFFR